MRDINIQPSQWVLGASDPEMALIERILRDSRQVVAHAEIAGRRVRGEEMYRCDLVSGPALYVECAPAGAPADIDHHRPGDRGFGRPPAEFLEASSVGQVLERLAATRRLTETQAKKAGWRQVRRAPRPELGGGWFENALPIGGDLLHGNGDYTGCPWVGWFAPPREILLTAAADHCLGAAYRGECPGVDPADLRAFRVAERAAFQGRTVEEVESDITATLAAMEAAPRIVVRTYTCARHRIGPEYAGYPCISELEDGCPDDDCIGFVFRDMRSDTPWAELPEAATIADVAYIAGPFVDPKRPDSPAKFTCSGSALHVRAFMEHFAPDNGLENVYGDPSRGFAGAYAPTSERGPLKTCFSTQTTREVCSDAPGDDLDLDQVGTNYGYE